MTRDRGLFSWVIFELVAQAGFRKHFHFGGPEATQNLLEMYPLDSSDHVLNVGCALVIIRNNVSSACPCC